MSLAQPEATTGARLRLRLNPIRCTAFGFCAEFAPELFGLDEWGYAWPRGQEVPAGQEALAEEAASLCPTRAIVLERIRRESGANATRSQPTRKM